MKFKDIQPRYFEPSLVGNIPGGKRNEHVMLIGGRDGPAVADLKPRDERYWAGGEQKRWTAELEGNRTYSDARTQPRLLREVRGEQRLYGKGYMKVSDMSDVLMRTLSLVRPRSVLTELTIQDETGKLLALPVTVDQGPVFTGLLPGVSSAPASLGAPLFWLKGGRLDDLTLLCEAAASFSNLSINTRAQATDAAGTSWGISIRKPIIKGEYLIAIYKGGSPTGKTYASIREQIEAGDAFLQSAEDIKAAGEVYPVGSPPRREVGGKVLFSAVGGSQISIPLKNVQQVTLVDPYADKAIDKPYFSRLFGIQGEFEGEQRIFPFYLIARLRAIRESRKDRPTPQISTILGTVDKTEKLRQRAQKHLTRLAEEQWALAIKRGALRIQDGWDRSFVDPITNLLMRVTPDKELIWAATSLSNNAVALLRDLYPGKGDIVVNVDDYLRLSRLQPTLNLRDEGKKVRSNPLRGPMNRFNNPIRYLSDREIQAGAEYARMSEAQFLASHPQIQRKSEKPKAGSKQSMTSYIPAGRRLAQSGYGLKVTRRNSGRTGEQIRQEIKKTLDRIYHTDFYTSEGMFTQDDNRRVRELYAELRAVEGPGATIGDYSPPIQYSRTTNLVSNPFNKVTEPGPGKHQVTSKRGKTLYMTPNQIAKMGDKMLMPGEVQRALGRSNPRKFRGVKQAMSPAEKEHARLMRKHSGTSATHLLTAYDPEEQMVGDHIERGISRRQKKAAGTYGSVNDEVPGDYDEAEFQKHMANLGLKSNPRRR